MIVSDFLLGWIFSGLLFIILLFFIFKITKLIQTTVISLKQQPKIEHSLYVLNLNITAVGSDVEKQINSIRRKYETNPDKPENSRHLFLEEIDKIIKRGCKTVVESLSNESRAVLINHFSEAGLVNYILSQLSTSI